MFYKVNHSYLLRRFLCSSFSFDYSSCGIIVPTHVIHMQAEINYTDKLDKS